MPHTMHITLRHEADVVKEAILPTDQLSEQTAKFFNKHIRLFRINY